MPSSSPIVPRAVALALTVAGLAHVVACQPCVTNDMCGAGNICAAGVCRPESAGSGGLSNVGGGASSSSGGADGGFSGDAGSVTIPLTVAPTAVALTDTGLQAYVADPGNGAPRLTAYGVGGPDAGMPTSVPLSAGASPACSPTIMVIRGTRALTGCDSAGIVRAYTLGTGLADGTDDVVGAQAMAVDHSAMVGISSTDNAGGVVFTSPVANPAARSPAPDSLTAGRRGMALLETAGQVDGAATVSSQGMALVSYTLNAGNFVVSNAAVLLDYIPDLISSARPATGGFQAVITASTSEGVIKTYSAQDVRMASGGAVLTPQRVHTNLSMALGTRLKARRDGAYVYYFSNTTPPGVCRAQLSAGTEAASCRPLPVDCTPEDLAPAQASGPTVVACSNPLGAGALVTFPGF